MDLVSIIVPVYNMENFIEAGLNSLLEQTYPETEILLIDDGSTDKSLIVCKEAEKKYDFVRVFHKENGGSGSARNLGIENAQGKYMYFHDIDDYIKPEAIERLVEAIETHDTDLVVCGFEMFNGERVTKTVNRCDGLQRSGAELRADFYEHCFMYEEKGILGAAWGKLYRSEIIKEHNIRYPDLRRHQDEVFVARYTEHIRGVYFIGDALCRYFVNTSERLWGKLPADYYDIARQSFYYLKDTVCKWNPDNTEVFNKVRFDFFYKTFLAMWEQLNPKHGFSFFTQYRRIKEITEDYLKLCGDDFNAGGNHVFTAMKKRRYPEIYLRLIIYTHSHKYDDF